MKNLSRHIQKVKLLFISPREFINSIQKENKYITSWGYYLFFEIIGLIILFISGMYELLKESEWGPYVTFGILLSPVAPFIEALISQVSVLIVGGKQGFFKTYKVITYSTIIHQGYAIIAGIIFWIFVDIKASFAQFILPLIVIRIVTLIGFLRSLHLEIIGLMKYQKLSVWRAGFVAFFIYIVGFILGIIVGIILAIVG